MVRRALAPLALAVPLALSACRTPSTEIPVEALEEADRDQPTGEASQAPDPLPVEAASDLIPGDAMVYFEASRPTELLRLFTSLAEIPEFQGARNEAADVVGADLLDARQWANVGIDADGPMGIALFDPESQAGCFYVTVSDLDEFEAMVRRIVARIDPDGGVATSEIEGAVIMRLSEELSIVVRASVAVMVLVDRPTRAPRDYTAMVATMDPRDSLGHSEGFVWARAKVGDSDDGMLYLAPKPILDAMAATDDEYAYGTRYAQDALDEARRRGAPPEEIGMLEEQLAREQEWARDRQRAREAERELMEQIVGSVEAVYAAGDLRDDGLDAHGQLLIRRESPLRALFVPERGESPLFAALDEPALAIVDGQTDVQAMLHMVDMLAQADGASLAEVNAEILAETGLDVLGDLVPSLRGDGGFAITQSRPTANVAIADLPNTLGLAAHLGLDDPAPVRRALDHLARDKGMFGFLRRAKRGGGWTLALPEWRDVHIDVEGDRLLVSTDRGFTERVRDARPGSQAEVLRAADHPAWGSFPTPALRAYQDLSLLAILGAERPWPIDAKEMLVDVDAHHTLTPDEARKVRHSKAYKTKLKAFERLVADVNEWDAQRARNSFREIERVAERAGDLGVQVEARNDGLGLALRWRWAPGFSVVRTGAEAMFGLRIGGDDWQERERRMEAMFQALDELRRQRQADLDAAAAKRQR